MTIITEQSEGKVKEGSWWSNAKIERPTMGVLLMKRERDRERVRVQGTFPTRSIRNMNVDTVPFMTPSIENRGYTRYHQRQRQFSAVSRYHLNIEGKLIKQLYYMCLPIRLCRASTTFRPRFNIPLVHQANTRPPHWGIYPSTYPSIHPPIYWLTRTRINSQKSQKEVNRYYPCRETV